MIQQPKIPDIRRGLILGLEYRGSVSASGTVRDISGNENPATLAGNAYLDNRGCHLDGDADYLIYPGSDLWNFGSGDFAFCFWFNPSVEERSAIFADSSDYWLGMDFNWQGTRNLNAWASSTGSSWDILNADSGGNGIGTIQIALNEWSFVVFARSGTSWKTYIDAVNDVAVVASGSLVNRSSANKYIGRWGIEEYGYYALNGSIDDFRIYNRALTAPEIAVLYHRGKWRAA